MDHRPGRFGAPSQPRVKLNEAIEIIVGGKGGVRIAVHADQLSGNALAYLGLVSRLREDN